MYADGQSKLTRWSKTSNVTQMQMSFLFKSVMLTLNKEMGEMKTMTNHIKDKLHANKSWKWHIKSGSFILAWETFYCGNTKKCIYIHRSLLLHTVLIISVNKQQKTPVDCLCYCRKAPQRNGHKREHQHDPHLCTFCDQCGAIHAYGMVCCILPWHYNSESSNRKKHERKPTR